MNVLLYPLIFDEIIISFEDKLRILNSKFELTVFQLLLCIPISSNDTRVCVCGGGGGVAIAWHLAMAFE